MIILCPGDRFTLTMDISWKLIEKVVKELRKAGYETTEHRRTDQQSDDHILEVEVDPTTCTKAYDLIMSLVS